MSTCTTVRLSRKFAELCGSGRLRPSVCYGSVSVIDSYRDASSNVSKVLDRISWISTVPRKGSLSNWTVKFTMIHFNASMTPNVRYSLDNTVFAWYDSRITQCFAN